MSGIPNTPAEARKSHLESVFWRRTLRWGLRTIPPRVERASLPLWSGFFYLQVPHIRRAIHANLRRLHGLRSPRRDLVAFRTFTNYCGCVAQAYRYYLGEDPTLEADVVGLENMERALDGGEGAVVATGHLGNWQLGPHFLSQHGFPQVTVVMEAEPDAGVQRMEQASRDQKMRVVYPRQSPLLSLELRSALRRGELVGFQMDRALDDRGLRVPCAGGAATFAPGPALLARVCQVPVVPVFFPLVRGRLQIDIQPPLWAEHTNHRDADLLELTTRLAAVYSRQVRRYTDQWFNFYDFWAGE